MTKKNKLEYYASKLRPIIQIALRLTQSNPNLLNDPDMLWVNMQYNVPALKKIEECACCNRSMKITVYEADLLDALLIYTMAKQVRINISQGMTFTEANKIHLPTLGATQGTLKRQTKCDYLGLVKQPDNWRGTGYWLLTSWAWKALRGEQIPRSVKYWEGKFLGRSDEMITLKEMFNNHKELVQKALQKRKVIKTDHRAIFNDYDPREWGEVIDDTPDQQRLRYPQ